MSLTLLFILKIILYFTLGVSGQIVGSYCSSFYTGHTQCCHDCDWWNSVVCGNKGFWGLNPCPWQYGQGCLFNYRSDIGVGEWKEYCEIVCDSGCLVYSPCTNKPLNAYYTSSGISATNCSWQCNTPPVNSVQNPLTCLHTCDPAPANSTQNTTSCTWNCNAGFYANNSTCMPCTYKPPDTFYLIGGTNPTDCPWQCNAPPSNSSQNMSTCLWTCNAGYYANNTTCSACTLKPSNAFFTGPGTNASNCPWQCNAPPSNSSQNMSTCLWTCNSGYYSNSIKCDVCTLKPSNSFFVGPGTNASNCPWQCKVPPSNSSQNMSTCQWTCNTGYYYANNSTECHGCTLKPSNAYFIGPGPNASSCPWQCNAPPNNSSQNTSTCLWTCNSGYYSNSTVCDACTLKPSNSFFIGRGTDASNCPWQCKVPPKNSSQNMSTCQWTCNAGYYYANNSTECHACTLKPSNAYFIGPGPNASSCPWQCNAPPGNSSQNMSTCLWTCNAGYYANSTTCSACTLKPSNSFFTGLGTNASNCPWQCNPTPNNSVQNITTCSWVCNVGFYANSNECARCTVKPSNAYFIDKGTNESNCPWKCNPIPLNSVQNLDTCIVSCNAGFFNVDFLNNSSLPTLELNYNINFDAINGDMIIGPFDLMCWNVHSPWLKHVLYTNAIPFIENWENNNLNIPINSNCQWFSVPTQSFSGPVFSSYERYIYGLINPSTALVQNINSESFCQKCDLGTYKSMTGLMPCTKCPPGTVCDELGMTSPKPCLQGTYLNISGAMSLLQCLPCPAGTFLLYNSMDSLNINPCSESLQNSSDRVFELNALSSGKKILCENNGTIIRSSCDSQSEKYMTISVKRAYMYNLDMRNFKNPFWWVRIYACDSTEVYLDLQNYYYHCDLQNTLDFTGGNTENDQYNRIWGKQLFLHFSIINMQFPNCYAEDALEVFGYQKVYSIEYVAWVQPNTFPVQCVNCPKGSFGTAVGSTACTLCEIGKYNEVEGQSDQQACLLCPSGTFNNDEGSHICISCEPGTYLKDNICEACQPGSYNNIYYGTACYDCEIGTYSFNSKSTACDVCQNGTVAGSKGLTSCVHCPAGKYSNIAVLCHDCRAGNYASEIGSSICRECDIGSFGVEMGQTACQYCLPGTYGTSKASVGYNNSCTKCRAGTYNSRFIATECKLCPLSTYASSEGQTACTQCLNGSITSTQGSSSAQQCIQKSNNFTCTSCRKCPSEALYAKTTCRPDQINEIDDTVCVCPRLHYYNAELNLCVKCKTCPLSSRTFRFCEEDSRKDMTVCFCPPSSYGNPNIRCLPCPVCTPSQNTFPIAFCNSRIRSEKEIERCVCASGLEGYGCCPPGKFCLPETEKANVCAPGTYTPLANMTACIQCSPSMYQTNSSATSCIHCPVSKTSSSNKGVFCS